MNPYTEHVELMAQARQAIDAARLRGVSSLKICEALLWLELHRPVAAIKALA